jgi:hypothetical protein
MKKSLLGIAFLAVLLLAAALAPASAGGPAPATPQAVQPVQPAWAQTPAGCAPQAVAPAAGGQSVAPAVAGLTAPEPLFAAAGVPCPIVRCAFSPCTQSNECTAAPGGSCNLYCNHPKQGCCVYP